MITEAQNYDCEQNENKKRSKSNIRSFHNLLNLLQFDFHWPF